MKNLPIFKPLDHSLTKITSLTDNKFPNWKLASILFGIVPHKINITTYIYQLIGSANDITNLHNKTLKYENGETDAQFFTNYMRSSKPVYQLKKIILGSKVTRPTCT